MKKFLTHSLYLLASLLMLSTLAQAQTSAGRYQIRLVHSSLDCAKDSVKACLEIRATSADSAFVMGSANILFSFQNNQLASPTIQNYYNFHDTNIYSFIDLIPTVGPNSTVVSLNIVNNGRNGAGTTVGTDWVPIACIGFAITPGNTTKCYSLTLSASQPSTVVTRAYPNPSNPSGLSLTQEISQGTLTSIANQCPVNPIVTLSGGGTINSGGSANLVVTSQNNILPATVAINPGLSVTLTQQEPNKTLSVSPSQTTDYTIQSVTGSCGAGTGQGTAKVTVTGGPDPGNCPPAKCVPLTIRILN
ncbi:MAG: hypothetical protein U0X91_25010 [Spirosomataceae bacterium]